MLNRTAGAPTFLPRLATDPAPQKVSAKALCACLPNQSLDAPVPGSSILTTQSPAPRIRGRTHSDRIVRGR